VEEGGNVTLSGLTLAPGFAHDGLVISTVPVQLRKWLVPICVRTEFREVVMQKAAAKGIVGCDAAV
jgi:hypothetical protein